MLIALNLTENYPHSQTAVGHSLWRRTKTMGALPASLKQPFRRSRQGECFRKFYRKMKDTPGVSPRRLHRWTAFRSHLFLWSFERERSMVSFAFWKITGSSTSRNPESLTWRHSTPKVSPIHCASRGESCASNQRIMWQKSGGLDAGSRIGGRLEYPQARDRGTRLKSARESSH